MQSEDAEFDQYEGNYQTLVEDSMSFSGMSHDYVTRVKADLIVAVAEQRFGGLAGRRVLDVGCGVGLSDTFLVDRPWQVAGTDVSPKSIEQAKRRNPTVDYVVGDGGRLPFDDGSFDVCFTICVMHHVPPQHWTDFLREMRRVLKPDGIAMVLEHNPYNPLTRLVVNRCPFDADAVLLSKSTLRQHLDAAQLVVHGTHYFLFTPWERLQFVDRLIGWLPLGAQYCVTATR
jgi:ubiquinone/menaquinone biosynthesis C-methylase UbiE